ncbi:nucleoside deaminase [Candidatus Woesebacteria bacterium]|nr:nucleoside deaminase [Candidatus Woesebacteria bacterium]
MNNDEKFIRLAIEEANKSVAANGAPIGAVLVKNGEVIATGWSLVWPKKDPSAHAETECMKAACQKLQSLDLSGCTLYSTLESCSMCLGCAGWTGLSRIVFGAFKEDVLDNPYELGNYHAVEHAKNLKPIGGGKIEVVGGVLREECKALMAKIKNWSPTE